MTQAEPHKFHLLAANPGKRRTEIIYLVWFLVTVPLQGLVVMNLSYERPNDPALVGQAIVMALGTLIWPLVFRVPEDRGRPLTELYGFRMGVFLTIWAVLGGFVGTDPWYEVLHGHFAFHTAWNPNGVPLFMLPMTISVFGFYTVILGTLYRVLSQLLDRTGGVLARDSPARHAVLCLLLAGIMPLGETFAYSGYNYCFDNGVGMWGLNVLIYGSWHFAALLFYTRWDRLPGERASLRTAVVSGFATIGILMVLMAITKTFIAPHFVDVVHGVRHLNDWSPDNCLGPKP
ncbi:hypothetical protein [Mycobacterium sp. 48b]|uniref:hypothetical protein n=1 Tax=Mycobacterium sp. 48b TaxID=3400426 RepID=UPI003AAE4700